MEVFITMVNKIVSRESFHWNENGYGDMIQHIFHTIIQKKQLDLYDVGGNDFLKGEHDQ